MNRLIADMRAQAQRLRTQQALYRLSGEPEMVWATREAARALELAAAAYAQHDAKLAECQRVATVDYL